MTASTRRQQLEQMLSNEPGDSFLRYGLAMEFVSEGNDVEAVQHFRDLIAAAPDYVPAYMQAAQAYMRLDQNPQASAVLSAGIVAAQREGDLHAKEEMEGFLAGLA